MNQDSVVPVNGRVLIEVLDEIQEYKGSLQLLETVKEKSNIAIIKRLPIGYNGTVFEEGDRIMFNKHSGVGLTFDKFDKNAQEYRLILESDILAKINVPDCT